MNSYCFMSIEKIKTAATFSRKQAHNLREGFVPNADITRTFMNEELIKPENGKSFNQFYKDKIKESPVYKNKKVRKDAVRGLEIVCTYSNPKTGNMPEGFSIDEWKKLNVEWLKETFGEDNIASVVVHMDEVTPHIHAIVIPMVEGQLNATHYIGKKHKLSHLQDTYGEKMSKVGLSRGLKHSCAKHTDIRKFYAELNNTLAKELPPVKEKETVNEYRERANEIYQTSNIKHLQELKQMERQLVEHRTYDLQSVIEMNQEQKKLKQEKEEFQRERDLFEEEYHASPEDTRSALQSLYEMKRSFETYEDQEYANAVLQGLHEIEQYYKEHYQLEDRRNSKNKRFTFNKDTNEIELC